MSIKFGSIEYFELESFQDKLKNRCLDKLDLISLDRLRTEVAMKLAAINEEENNRRMKNLNNEQKH